MTARKLYQISLFLLFTGLPSMQVLAQNDAPYTDTSHYSYVFGHQKSYRLYLPYGYDSSGNRYPVIYFLHGWGGRHFKDDNALLEYEKIQLLVDKYQAILVMLDGNIDTAEPRPYNTGNHEDVKFKVQEKEYFPELITHVDSAYRTLTDRQHRGIIGFSMGGFMSFFLAGKYPDKVIAAVSLAGSPEFFLGYPENHTLYPVRYAFKNLADVYVRMHNGDSDILYFLNDEVKEGAKWEGVALDYWKFHGGHMVDQPGETTVFEMAMKFITGAFLKDPAPKPRWSHYDLYPNFSAWDYHIKTNIKEPGFWFIKNVDKSGFGFYTRKWLPDGPSFPLDSIQVTTAPVYKAGKKYHIVNYETKTGNLNDRVGQADTSGRLSLFFTRAGIETGIYEDRDDPSFIFLDHSTGKNTLYLHNRQTGILSIRLFNRGGTRSFPGKIKVTISTTDSSTHYKNNAVETIIAGNQRIIQLPSFKILCRKQAPLHAEPPQVKFYISIQYGGKVFRDDFIVPVLYDAPLFDSIKVDDMVPVRKTAYGKGDGNGIANAGENIMLYSGSHRLRLYTEDKWVLAGEEKIADEVIPAIWPDGYTLSSLVKISRDCPDGHRIIFHASYETKAFNPIERKTTWGMVKLTIRNNRTTKKNSTQ